jgi:hypothetical protein
MNWYNKIKSLITQTDNSPELKNGEIKDILLKVAHKTFLDFEFLTYQNKCYIFQRIRRIDNFNIYETFHILFTLKDKNFACSVASSINPTYIYTNNYNIGLLNPHQDLTTLKQGSGIVAVNEAYYFHNGQVETTTKVVEQIFQDYKQYGIPYIEKQFEQLKENKIIKTGLDYINNLSVNKNELKVEIENENRKGGNITNPIFIDLKEKLQSISGQTRENRQLIPKTTYEFLELYWTL